MPQKEQRRRFLSFDKESGTRVRKPGRGAKAPQGATGRSSSKILAKGAVADDLVTMYGEVQDGVRCEHGRPTEGIA